MENVLIVPGLHGSGPAHWQSWLHAQLPGSQRVEQADSATPDLPVWSQRLQDAIGRASAPVWIVAHSFGSLAALHATARQAGRVEGVLLVAPADPDKFGVAHLLPRESFPAPAILAASANDPWMGLEKAHGLARSLGLSFLNLGRVGHVNTESGHGPWPQGLALLRMLQAAVAA
ncbi:MAG: alpha/beta hydrolase [Candidatus Dactylopiibacterium sp.]|nr:alpha/beta hydrolase [Candidatus Dactylopiibacterium sp.]